MAKLHINKSYIKSAFGMLCICILGITMLCTACRRHIDETSVAKESTYEAETYIDTTEVDDINSEELESFADEIDPENESESLDGDLEESVDIENESEAVADEKTTTEDDNSKADGNSADITVSKAPVKPQAPKAVPQTPPATAPETLPSSTEAVVTEPVQETTIPEVPIETIIDKSYSTGRFDEVETY